MKKLMLITVLVVLFASPTFADLRIYHIDVDQADATLFVSPSGNTLLVDSGKNGHGPRIKRVMDAAGVNRIDHFVCTHYHEDHYGGIDDLAGDPSVTIGAVYDRGDKQHLPSSKINSRTYEDYDTAVGRRAMVLSRGETIPLDPGEMTVTCVAKGGVVLGEQSETTGTDENDMSIALLVQYGDFRYFIGGDIEHTTENKLANRDMVMDVDVYQSNHHGSHSSSSWGFMTDMTPSVIIISNGSYRKYRHPRQSTLNLYSRLDPQPVVFQTNKYSFSGDEGGNVPDAYIADLNTDGDDGTILVTVNNASTGYSVSYRSYNRTYQTKNRGTSNVSVVIESLLPNPVGSDRDNEEVTLRNTSSNPVDISGWTLMDESGRIWSLTGIGTLNPGQSISVRRNGMPMSLNNDGDTIVLMAENSSEITRFEYSGSVEGQRINTGY